MKGTINMKKERYLVVAETLEGSIIKGYITDFDEQGKVVEVKLFDDTGNRSVKVKFETVKPLSLKLNNLNCTAGAFGGVSGNCPNCDYKWRISERYPYCPWCGQSLDWDD